jgi:hypothetical protein
MPKAEDFLGLKDQLKAYIGVMDQAATVIKDQGVSKYPIMVVHRQEVEIGIPLAFEHNLPGQWSMNASTLEEFVSKKIIEDDKIEDFRILYKQHDNHVCIFILSELGAQFIFFEKR